MIPGYRHATWDTPWWVNSSRAPGRYNTPSDPPTQYWCTHPLGVAAEFLRWNGQLDLAELKEVRLRLWAAKLDDDELVRVSFDNADDHDMRPEDLIGEDYTATQHLAMRLREAGVPGMVVPSAALPGAETVVLFGPRLAHPYLLEPVDPDQVATSHIAEALVPAEILPLVRHKGTGHLGFVEWRAKGTVSSLIEPPVPRN